MIEINNLTRKKINKPRVEKIVKIFFKKFNIKSDKFISLAIISDYKMKQINFTYRGKNKATDVLTFCDLNEIIINIEEIIRQAKKTKKRFQDEFDFILVHGLLHLLGYNDDTEKKRLEMIGIAEKFLEKIK